MNTTAHSNNTSSALASLEQCLDSLGVTGERMKLDGLRIAIINNVNYGRDSDSIPRACNWFTEKHPSIEIGEIPEDLKDFLEWLQPTDQRYAFDWATAAMNCIESELEDMARIHAISWLNQELAQSVGASAAITHIADYLQPVDGPMNMWAECAFERMLDIDDPDEQQAAIDWLKSRIAERLGTHSASRVINDWMRKYQPIVAQATETRVCDTDPCPPPAPSETDVSELITKPNTSTKRKKGKKKETLNDVEQRIAQLKRDIHSQEAQLRDKTGGDEQELSRLQAKLLVAEAKRRDMLPSKKQQRAA